MHFIFTTLAALAAAASALTPPTTAAHAELIPEIKNQCLKTCVQRYQHYAVQIKKIFCSDNIGQLMGKCIDETCEADRPYVFEEYGSICGHYPTPTPSPSPSPTPTADPIPALKQQCLKSCVAFYHLKTKTELCNAQTGQLIGECVDDTCKADTPLVFEEYGLICGHYPTPTPRSSTPSPTPSPTQPFAPFGSPCPNQCVNQDTYKDLAGFCKAAKDDYQLWYCAAKLCNMWDRDLFNKNIDWACAATPSSSSTPPPSSTTPSPSPTSTFHPFKVPCLNECVDVNAKKYKDMTTFCKEAKLDTDLYFCAAKRCYFWNREMYETAVDEACTPPPSSTTPPPEPSTSESVSPPFPCWNKTLCSKPRPHPTSHPPITITTTVTDIETLTYCPPRHTCTGQTTTWTWTFGPTSCPPTVTCTCVLPGGHGYPTLETCPPSVTCTGQTTEITEGVTVVLPSETIPSVPANPTEPAETSSVVEFPGAAASAGVGFLAALFGVMVAL
ncbi:hypothetical protein BU26DRAFT_518083 [Trematosphaeria pertusa]|uniref:Extracellular membrane protein CFEM domain-containing protein n=1 Tax=Trematosphaeria pertusa TaxID=390896 RepID=A0A6A6ILD1_9PLEO|nr:uncharacterized protein BU26DRAFT_518083 [Trematosphaeria pertusa]KAF2251425.1 hypothetical protein BU26DRAFT_518083 [Trematosphaeria pertusa]